MTCWWIFHVGPWRTIDVTGHVHTQQCAACGQTRVRIRG